MPWVERIGQAVEYAGVVVMVVGMGWAVAAWVGALARGAGSEQVYQELRRRLGRAILLGLEFLVAGDILRTVAIDPTPVGVAVLGGIVLIRTFLSFTIEMEVEGRWPWQRPDGSERPGEPRAPAPADPPGDNPGPTTR